MNRRALHLYYASMIVYMLASIFFILYGLVIRPVSLLYHEDVRQMVSPVFGNFYMFMLSLVIISVTLTVISLALFLASVAVARKTQSRLSAGTLIFPVLLYLFAFTLLGVSGI
ncbi:MAG: hypothetical protein KIY12_09210 [Thermoplasmata archaeon]|uniref:Uncharacterized protein n=1 Tax=Candidatus Sysuiplasma superficiale TaxID=2823368 RepID=A0A8J7YQC6_9ARCH|nr:hypothetical protein [Candidatus Sysuiplasma superficiale]MBX8644878.1 hypothetical protein [Candidatus Sysuiplasma superficiale]MCL4347333.1 hypothetical protein [Candidatus Thermoplasmatota archaeon]